MTPTETFTQALSNAQTEDAVYEALCTLGKELVGAKLFTVMTADMDAMLARRVFTDDPANYPTSGTKPVELNSWFDVVHGRRESFVANTLDDISKVFGDWELIGQLGCGSVVNLPVVIGGKMVATVNMLHEAGYYTPERVAAIEEHLTLPATAAVSIASNF
ncbi:GAF domain-containing protein [Marivivens aquimaris]|uniref:GAF domain-containing protein n=1 Tax=Marivivens aquimaris TaxID=2774876 RepID=UPI001881B60E|nr:GAF domain-containing protein [Marivivens aquimaris]